jgi:hypothetical protein
MFCEPSCLCRDIGCNSYFKGLKQGIALSIRQLGLFSGDAGFISSAAFW